MNRSSDENDTSILKFNFESLLGDIHRHRHPRRSSTGDRSFNHSTSVSRRSSLPSIEMVRTHSREGISVELRGPPSTDVNCEQMTHPEESPEKTVISRSKKPGTGGELNQGTSKNHRKKRCKRNRKGLPEGPFKAPLSFMSTLVETGLNSLSPCWQRDGKRDSVPPMEISEEVSRFPQFQAQCRQKAHEWIENGRQLFDGVSSTKIQRLLSVTSEVVCQTWDKMRNTFSNRNEEFSDFFMNQQARSSNRLSFAEISKLTPLFLSNGMMRCGIDTLEISELLSTDRIQFIIYHSRESSALTDADREFLRFLYVDHPSSVYLTNFQRERIFKVLVGGLEAQLEHQFYSFLMEASVLANCVRRRGSDPTDHSAHDYSNVFVRGGSRIRRYARHAKDWTREKVYRLIEPKRSVLKIGDYYEIPEYLNDGGTINRTSSAMRERIRDEEVLRTVRHKAEALVPLIMTMRKRNFAFGCKSEGDWILESALVNFQNNDLSLRIANASTIKFLSSSISQKSVLVYNNDSSIQRENSSCRSTQPSAYGDASAHLNSSRATQTTQTDQFNHSYDASNQDLFVQLIELDDPVVTYCRPSIIEIRLGNSYLGKHRGEIGWSQRQLMGPTSMHTKQQILHNYYKIRENTLFRYGLHQSALEHATLDDLNLCVDSLSLIPSDVSRLLSSWESQLRSHLSPSSVSLGFHLCFMQLHRRAISHEFPCCEKHVVEFINEADGAMLNPSTTELLIQRALRNCNKDGIIATLTELKEWISIQDLFLLNDTTIQIVWETQYSDNEHQSIDETTRPIISWRHFGKVWPLPLSTLPQNDAVDQNVTVTPIVNVESSGDPETKSYPVSAAIANSSVIFGLQNLINLLSSAPRTDNANLV